MEAPRLARRYLASKAAAWPAGLFDLVVLLTNELVTNAVVHGRRPVELRLTDDGNQIKIEISDGDPTRYRCHTAERPRVQDHRQPGRPVGRRLRRTPPGKTVWFELGYQSAG